MGAGKSVRPWGPTTWDPLRTYRPGGCPPHNWAIAHATRRLASRRLDAEVEHFRLCAPSRRATPRSLLLSTAFAVEDQDRKPSRAAGSLTRALAAIVVLVAL